MIKQSTISDLSSQSDDDKPGDEVQKNDQKLKVEMAEPKKQSKKSKFDPKQPNYRSSSNNFSISIRSNDMLRQPTNME